MAYAWHTKAHPDKLSPLKIATRERRLLYLSLFVVGYCRRYYHCTSWQL